MLQTWSALRRLSFCSDRTETRELVTEARPKTSVWLAVFEVVPHQKRSGDMVVVLAGPISRAGELEKGGALASFTSRCSEYTCRPMSLAKQNAVMIIAQT